MNVIFLFHLLLLYLYNEYGIENKYYDCEKYSNNVSNKFHVLNPSQFGIIRSIITNNFTKSIIIIPICCKNIYRRIAIRNTWAKYIYKLKYRIIFYMGYSSICINNDDNDIIQFSFIDSYFNLTISTMLIYNWTTKIADYFDNIIKVDSDVYPNLQLIELYINLNKENKRIIYGYYYPQMKTNRNKSNPNYIPHVIYPFNVIPHFVAGNFYIFPKFKEWNSFIETMNLSSKKLIYREDIQLGLYLNNNGINIEKINNYYKRKKKFVTCKNYILYLAVHGINIRKMLYIDSKCQIW